ncbi:MAG: hypothetical protein KKC76_02655 [Proteobacteria bacterium]|nr:hypothetical protein [Pseudomonadota bacterium]MBU4295628.1 hypothetical protein [Pseudomonadota bacterium]MCG2746819.1 hypothetical protein [Desulfobulbaceae bacterium]
MERRIFQRFSLALNGSLFLCQAQGGERLSRPVNCQVVDLSKRGAGLIIWQIIVDNLHLFFGPLESNQLILHLTIDQQGTEAPPLNLTVRPLWFNRILFEEQQPFKMGIEFFEKIGEDDFRRLKKLAGR